MSTHDPRKPSHRLTFDEAVDVWLQNWRGEFKNRIAAGFDVNVGRIYEVLDGKLRPGSEAAAREIWDRQHPHKPAA